eukprot:scaffold39782_cov82-Phaeocystis_antarctica.AAC.3
MVMSVLGCRSPNVSRCPSSASRHSGSAAARSPLACNSVQQRAEVADGGQRVRMPIAERLAPPL